MTEANDVRIERNDQLGGRHARPDAEIDLVRPHHPAQVQVQALARAPRGRTGKEVAHPGALRYTSVGASNVERQGASREAVERGADIFMLVRQAFDKELLEASVTIEHLAQNPEQRDQVNAARPAVHHRAKLGVRGVGFEASHEGGRMRSQDPEQRGNRVDDARDPAKRECRRAEPGDLAILVAAIRPHEMHGVCRRLLAVVGVVELVEARPKRLRNL